jgi:serine/threonine-protein kinase RsbW
MKKKTFLIESDPENLSALREGLRSFLTGTGLSDKSVDQMLVAAGEACTNSMRHAYGGEKGRKIRVTAQDLKDKIVLTVRDYGKKIVPSQLKEPKLPPEEPGGLGVYFMKTMTDDMKYNTAHARGNELTLVKLKEK